MCMSSPVDETPLDRLSSFIASLDFDDLPSAVVEKAKIHIADTLGAALAGTRSGEFRLASSLTNGGGVSRVWGTKESASAREAALINGVAAHAFELDDAGGCDHSGAVVLPALFAALFQTGQPVSGKELIVATVAGYEVGRRILEAAGGYDAHNGIGWHSTGTCGTLAAAAAVARLWRLPAVAYRDAISLSTSFSSGLWAFIHDGSQAKKIHAGRAAEGGLLAAELAARGFSGPSKVFDDVWGGFFRAFNQTEGEVAKLSEDLGEVWKINRAVLKPYASCRGAHSAVDALEDILAETRRPAETIASIHLDLSRMLIGMCGAKETRRLAAAQMSLPYALAARCVFGSVGLESYSAARRADPRIAELFSRTTLSVDDAMQPLDEPVVTLTFADGTEVSRTVPRATGSAERPMAADAITAKFRRLAAMAMPEAQVLELEETLANLEDLQDCNALEALLCSDVDEQPVFA
jgi:2-methylcitrate dehydratase PrpD